jgi:hypothetical protein
VAIAYEVVWNDCGKSRQTLAGTVSHASEARIAYFKNAVRFDKTEHLGTCAEAEKWHMKLHSTHFDYLWHNDLEEESI